MFPSDFGDSGKLDRLYICQKCKRPFLFRSDVQEHVISSGHKDWIEVPLDEKSAFE